MLLVMLKNSVVLVTTLQSLKSRRQIIGANLASASGSVTVTDPDAKNVISNLKPGYYLIKDQDNSLQGQESYTEFILHITDDVVANCKGRCSFCREEG